MNSVGFPPEVFTNSIVARFEGLCQLLDEGPPERFLGGKGMKTNTARKGGDRTAPSDQDRLLVAAYWASRPKPSCPTNWADPSAWAARAK
jgi:hypothetical protein